jgi:electron transport complex protein RnfC
MYAKTFRKKGIHPPGNKEKTAALPIEVLPAPKKVVLPLSQHIGAPAKPLVAVGDEVKPGQKIGEAQGMVSATLHASIGGKVTAIEERPHPAGKTVPAIVIENTGSRELAPVPGVKPCRPLAEITADEIKELMREGGLVGMGGAAFPTHVKYYPPAGKKIEYVILNGAECEPFLTSDHRLMLERPEAVLYGLKAMMKAAGAAKGYIGVELNKVDVIKVLQEKVKGDASIEIVPLQVKYPQGEEKMLIYAITGRVVPAGGLPVDVGVVVNNVATAAALADLLQTGKPLISRVITVTGSGIKEPKNLEVPVGTLLEDVFAYCGGLKENAGKIILGGPMTGPAHYRLDLPVLKGTSGILVQTGEEVETKEYMDCIRCAKCIEACPYSLLPNYLGLYGEKDRLEEAKKYGAMECRECGSCTYVCPSRRPLTQWIKDVKRKIAAAERKTG